MDLNKLSDHAEVATPIHPALDIVDDVLYVTVLVLAEGQLQHVVLTSEGEALGPDEWTQHCKERGLVPRCSVNLARCGQRWPAGSMISVLGGLAQGKKRAPTWSTVYNAIYRALDERLQLAAREYLDVIALYSMMTYFHPLFAFLPILHLLGPAESGKSRVGEAIAALSFNGHFMGDATRATMVRQAHQGRFTQVLAEGDHLAELNSGDQFVRTLQAGCTRAEASVEVAEPGGYKGTGYVPTTYYVFNPRVILSTRPFKSHPLRSRCIRLDWVKVARPDHNKLSVDMADETLWAALRARLYQLQVCRWQAVARERKRLLQTWRGPGSPTGRTLDKWLPLATMASLISPEVLGRVQRLAKEDMIQHQQDANLSDDAVLFHFARWLVREGTDRSYSRDHIDTLFRAAAKDDASDDASVDPVPLWAREADIAIRRSTCSHVARGPQVLIREMQRLHLLPKQSKHERGGNTYQLRYKTIRDIADANLGEEVIDASANSAA